MQTWRASSGCRTRIRKPRSRAGRSSRSSLLGEVRRMAVSGTRGVREVGWDRGVPLGSAVYRTAL